MQIQDIKFLLIGTKDRYVLNHDLQGVQDQNYAKVNDKEAECGCMFNVPFSFQQKYWSWICCFNKVKLQGTNLRTSIVEVQLVFL